MTTYTFDPAKADMVRDTMAAVTIKLTEELKNMHANVMKTLADWQDGAKEQYDIAKKAWDEAAARMPTSLNSAEVTLNQITGGYLKIEHTGRNAWGGYSVK